MFWSPIFDPHLGVTSHLGLRLLDIVGCFAQGFQMATRMRTRDL